MKNIKKNDEVKVITGKDKGKSGKVLGVNDNNTVLVEKINLAKRHLKRNQKFQGGIIDKPVPINISNVVLVCPTCREATKVDKKMVVEGKRVRSCKKCGEIIDK